MSPRSSDHRLLFTALALSLSFSLSLSSPARAEPSAADIESARILYKNALDLRKSGDDAGALAKLTAAFTLTKSPVVGLEIVRCEIALGKLVDAREHALEIESLPVTTKETSASADARAEATKLAAALEQRIATIAVRLTDVPAGTTPTVTLDAVAVPIELLGTARAVDPGAHVVRASVLGASAATKEVKLAEGESRVVTLSLAAKVTAPMEVEATTTTKTATDSAPAPAPAATGDHGNGVEVELAARTGYALPMGDAESGISMSDAFSGAVPIGFDAGVVVQKTWFVGAYFNYGFASTKSGGPLCPATASACSAHDVRAGVEVALHVHVDDARSDPWIGVGFGYEWATYGVTVDGATTSSSGTETVKGIELLNLQLGYDYRVAPQLALGPFVGFSLAKYTDYAFTLTNNGVSQPEKSGSIDDAKLHEWLFLGVRGAFRL